MNRTVQPTPWHVPSLWCSVCRQRSLPRDATPPNPTSSSSSSIHGRHGQPRSLSPPTKSGKPKAIPAQRLLPGRRTWSALRTRNPLQHFYAMSVLLAHADSIMTGQNAARHRTTNWITPDKNNEARSARRNGNGPA